MSDPPPRYVSYDRWDEAHSALARRVLVLEEFTERLQGAEQEHRAMIDRIANLESAAKAQAVDDHERRDRQRLVLLTVVSGLILPILTTAVIAFLHLHSVS